MVDARGEIIASNAAWQRASTAQTLQQTTAEASGAAHAAAMRRLGLDDRALANIAAVASGKAESVTLEYCRQTEGGERWFLLKATQLPGMGGAVVSHLDITSRKATENALALNEARFRSLVMHGMEAISIADATGVILYEAPAIERVLGYRPEELVGRLMPGIHPDDVEVGRKAMAQAFTAPGTSCDFTLRIRHKNGDYRHLAMTVTNMLDNPAVQGMVYNFRDVTEQVLADAELRFQAQFLDQALVSVFAMTVEGRITHWNRHACELFGWTAEEAIGRMAAELVIPPADTLDILAEFFQLRDWQGELVLQHKDGSAIDVHANLSPLTDEAGRVIGMVCVVIDLSERKRLEQQLRHHAVHDPLTGLPNRTLFADRLGVAIERARHQDSQVAVLFIDLDRFKLVNDSFGHAVGDLVLQGVARRLSHVLPASATLARLGGDEFVVVLEDVRAETEALAIAERMRATFASPLTVGEFDVQVGASIGITLGFTAQATPDALMREADAALYQVKASGRGGVFLFDRSTGSFATRELRLKQDLRRARSRKEFQLQYQPIVKLATGRVTQVEALIRWHHPEYGLILPDEFIPLAEETGMLVSIGTWVIRQACAQLAEWDVDPEGAQEIAMAVNLSARQFSDPNLVRETLAALQDFDLAPGRLILEITEDVLIQDFASTVQTLRLMRDAGVRVTIDDFGTGYSALSYLRTLPLHGIKLDRSFTTGLGTEAGSLAIMEAIIQMVHALDLEVTAEGVETADQLEILRGMGCDYGQGFYFSPAVDPNQFWAQAEQRTRYA